MRSILLKNRGKFCLVPCCLFFQLCCSGYFTDHQKPNSKKKVPGSACPLKLAIFSDLLLVLSSTQHYMKHEERKKFKNERWFKSKDKYKPHMNLTERLWHGLIIEIQWKKHNMYFTCLLNCPKICNFVYQFLRDMCNILILENYNCLLIQQCDKVLQSYKILRSLLIHCHALYCVNFDYLITYKRWHTVQNHFNYTSWKNTCL